MNEGGHDKKALGEVGGQRALKGKTEAQSYSFLVCSVFSLFNALTQHLLCIHFCTKLFHKLSHFIFTTTL